MLGERIRVEFEYLSGVAALPSQRDQGSFGIEFMSPGSHE